MPSLSYDSQSFIWNGNRLWMIGVNVEYALLAPERWRAALLSLKQMGFNTIRTSAPWCLHEPRAGRMDFTSALDVGAFVRLCGELGLRVVLRIGPVVGESFDGNGLPAWLMDESNIKLRVCNETFLRYVGKFYQAVGKEVAALQATVETRRGEGFAGGRANDGGPLCAVQIEHAWNCGNEPEGKKYHGELLRYARESGFTVPVLTNNGLWISVEGCIEVWEGWSDLFSHLRQLRTVQPNAPRFVEIREEAARDAGRNQIVLAEKHKGNERARTSSNQLANANANTNGWSDGMEYLRRMGQILCAGGQPTLPGVARIDRTNAVPAMLDAVGQPDNNTRQLRRMVSFSSNFGFVFAGADGSKQASVQDLDSLMPGSFAVVTVEGNGAIVFVFRGADEPGKPRRDATTIITPSGVRMPVHLGDAPVGWYLSDIQLHGVAVMDFCNLSPFAFIQKKMLVLQGAAQTYGVLSIDGAVIEFTIPKVGAKPLVFSHQKITVVVCNQEQIDATLLTDDGVTIGADYIRIGHDVNGHFSNKANKGASKTTGLLHATSASMDVQNMRAHLSAGFTTAFHVSLAGALTDLVISEPSKSVEFALTQWSVATCQDYVLGQSDRFATLTQPQSLAHCGAAAGWGWYKLSWTAQGKSSAAHNVHFPQAAGYMQAWLNGKYLGVLNEKPAALPLSIAARQSAVQKSAVLVGASSEFKNKGGAKAKANARVITASNTLTLLARQGGTGEVGAKSPNQHHASGVFGNALDVTALKTKFAVIDSPSVDPFKASAFLPGIAPGHHMSTHAAQISFSYSGEGAITIDAPATSLRAVVLLNGNVIDFIDWRGELGDALVLRASPKGSKLGLNSGVNQLVLLPVASDQELTAQSSDTTATKASKKSSNKIDTSSSDASAELYIQNMFKQLRFYQSTHAALANATWSFARWEMPGSTLDAWQSLKSIKSLKTIEPRWFTTAFTKPNVASGPISILCHGLSHGHILLNGKIVGDYNTLHDRARIELPTEAMPATNTLSIFDVQGRSPAGVKLSFAQ